MLGIYQPVGQEQWNKMVRRKKRRVPRIVRDIFIPIRFGTGAVLTGAFGTATQPLLPAGTTNPLTSISTSATRFAGPLTTIVGTGILVRQIRRLEPRKRKRKM